MADITCRPGSANCISSMSVETQVCCVHQHISTNLHFLHNCYFHKRFNFSMLVSYVLSFRKVKQKFHMDRAMYLVIVLKKGVQKVQLWLGNFISEFGNLV